MMAWFWAGGVGERWALVKAAIVATIKRLRLTLNIRLSWRRKAAALVGGDLTRVVESSFSAARRFKNS